MQKVCLKLVRKFRSKYEYEICYRSKNFYDKSKKYAYLVSYCGDTKTWCYETPKHGVMYSLGNAPIYQVFHNKTSSIALLTRFISKLKNLGIAQDINTSNK